MTRAKQFRAWEHMSCVADRYYDWAPNTPTSTPSLLTATNLTSLSSAQQGVGAGTGAPPLTSAHARLDYVGTADVKDQRAGVNAPGKKVRHAPMPGKSLCVCVCVCAF